VTGRITRGVSGPACSGHPALPSMTGLLLADAHSGPLIPAFLRSHIHKRTDDTGRMQ
jgi:hypothetical protein